MRYLALAEVLTLHNRVIELSGGSRGLRDLGGLESALAQPRATFGGEDLHASLVEKAAALAYSLISNHPFVDGNKRVSHASMEVFLQLNGHELDCDVDEQESLWLSLAAGQLSRRELTAWLTEHVRRAGEVPA
jgi:death-on-curing protein